MLDLDKLTFEKVIDKEIRDDSLFVTLSGRQNLVFNVEIRGLDVLPYSFPSVYLKNEDLIGKIPHISDNGLICYEAAKERTIVNYHLSSDDLLNVYIQDILKFLDRCSLAVYKDELYDEIEGFYSELKYIYSGYYATNESSYIYLKTKDMKDPYFIYENIRGIGNLDKEISKNDIIINGVHFALDDYIDPVDLDDLFKNIWIKIKSEEKRKFNLDFNSKKPLYILISLPRISNDNERAQFLFKIISEENRNSNLLDINLEKIQIEIFKIKRVNKEYLTQRGGASLIHDEISIIGVGSVGSEILSILSKSGISKFNIFDFDYMSTDNIYRHRLGLIYTGFPNSIRGCSKTESLKNHIEKNIPYVTIDEKRCYFTEDNIKELNKSSITIVSTGDVSQCLKLNSKLIEANIKNIIYVFNEPNGYGGHAIYINMEEMCFECLFNFDNQIEDSFGFIKSDESKVTKNLTGCAGTFTSFSYLDSVQTATLASRLALEVLFNQRSKSTIFSWKSEFAEGLSTTSNFDNISNASQIKFLEKNINCRCCNEG
ncbi:ThiF family adenylyltransferase [Francisella tularensis subsp. novicida]|uniref:ThiF family adenylyltransferase n=1 Tax=Francisella tularensis TaxID=263 RepID=UPI0008FCFC34|nr:ThiF family adenylyltransferase [Francisella tularensis]APC95820.1 thiF family protein [Francisella tularensis subsp. novicida]MBK2346736.1 ThiF family adenylyltransferase [Francisella tularensis subsp. novicida]